MATKTTSGPSRKGKSTSGRSSHDSDAGLAEALKALWEWILTWATRDGRREREKNGVCFACGMHMPAENLGMHMENVHDKRRGRRQPNEKKTTARNGKKDKSGKPPDNGEAKKKRWRENWRKSVAGSNVGDEIASIVSAWASREPETFRELRADMAGMDEAMRALADAFRRKQEQLVERQVAPECVDPMTEAATHASKIGELLTECVERINKRYDFFTNEG
jgi:hypothetical protein